MLKKILPKFFQIITLIAVVICLPGCGKVEEQHFNCISVPPEVTYFYPQDEWTTGKATPTFVPVGYTSWSVRFEAPSLGYAYQIIPRGDDQIWVLSQTLLLFNKKENRLKQYSIDWNGKEETPSRIFLARDNTLWAAGSHSEENWSLLSKFNDKTDRFESVRDSQNLLTMANLVSDIREDSNGQLWLLVSGKGVYTFDPVTAVARKMLPYNLTDKISIVSLVIDADDNLWMGTNHFDEQDSVLFFNTRTLQLSVLALGENKISGIVQRYSNKGLLVDKANRLWIGDYAYWDIGNPFPSEDYSSMNNIIRSPVFITQRRPYYDYSWLRPKILMEDSDGGIWFTSFGLVRLNPTTGVWCKVLDSSNYDSSIAEDDEGHFWTVEKGMLLEHK